MRRVRKKYLTGSLLLLTVLAAGCSRMEDIPGTAETTVPRETTTSPRLRSGEIAVKFDEGMTAFLEEGGDLAGMATRAAGAAADSLKISRWRRIFPDAGPYEPRTRKEGLHRWYYVSFDGPVAVTRAGETLASLPGVDLTETVPQVRMASFDDPRLEEQWAFGNAQFPEMDIQVAPVWERFTTGDSRVIVAVVDGGIVLDHEDLAANCLKDGHYNFVEDTTLIVPHLHGTHVAGTIAAVNGNGIGVAGIAGGNAATGLSGVSLLSCQMFQTYTDEDGTPYDAGGNSAAAIKWGADHGALISQNSWGYNYDSDDNGRLSDREKARALSDEIRSYDRDAVDYFIKYAGCDNDGNQLPDSPMKGGVVVFAAGNDGLSNAAPANYAPIIAVGAVTRNGRRAYYSNYGEWVDLCAPGSEILSTLPGNGYEFYSGTSMACPHVSGVAALLVSWFGGPGFTAEELTGRLLEGAARGRVTEEEGKAIGPLLDAYGSFAYDDRTVPGKVSDFSVSAEGNCLEIRFLATDAYRYRVIVAHDGETALAVDFNDLPDDVSWQDVNGLHYVPGQEVAIRIPEMDFDRTYHVTLAPGNYGGRFAERAPVKTVRTPENRAPMAEAAFSRLYTFLHNETVDVPYRIWDPDGHDFTVRHETDGQDRFIWKKADSCYHFMLSCLQVQEYRTYSARVTVTDQYGKETVLELPYEVLENTPPVKRAELEPVKIVAVGEKAVIDLKQYFSDAESELRFYATTPDETVVFPSVSRNGMLELTATGFGVSSVQVDVYDDKNSHLRETFPVLVRPEGVEVAVYPNPVTDLLHIVPGLDEQQTAVRLYSALGETVRTLDASLSAFRGAVLDVKDLPPGPYTLEVEYGSTRYTTNIIKL